MTINNIHTNSLESIGNLVKLISVRHPHLKLIRQSLKERTVASLDPGDHGLSVFVMKARSHGSSKDMSEFLRRKKKQRGTC
jgi:hypothetical protein